MLLVFCRCSSWVSILFVIYVKFCQTIFLHIVKYLYDFFLLICYIVKDSYIYISQIDILFLEKSQHGHSILFLLFIAGYYSLIFCLKSLHLYSQVKWVYNNCLLFFLYLDLVSRLHWPNRISRKGVFPLFLCSGRGCIRWTICAWKVDKICL